MRRAVVWILSVGLTLSASTAGVGEDRMTSAERMWHQLLREARALGLPSKFLQVVPPSFVQFEFDELHSYAAEYHPVEHRMVLNRALSFNGAGATLRPLERLTHAQIETLYHELFHAYLDYLMTTAETSTGVVSDPVLDFAKAQQSCRYGRVLISPIMQKKGQTEERFLSERESWEALNETWAVFVGWAVWNQLELTSGTVRSIQKPGKNQEEWIRRLKQADREGILHGYYEPEDPDERAIARKRYLAAASRLSEAEATTLMKGVLEFSPTLLARARGALSSSGDEAKRQGQCG